MIATMNLPKTIVDWEIDESRALPEQVTNLVRRHDIYVDRLKSDLSLEDRRYFEHELQLVKNELEQWKRILKQ